MTEGEGPEFDIDPEWQERMKGGIQDAFENYELFYAPSRDEVYGPLSFSPISLTEGEDEREFIELSPAEQDFVTKQFFAHLGIEGDMEKVGEYEYEAPVPSTEPDDSGKVYPQTWEGTTKVTIYKTGLSASEDKFLHEISFPDGKRDYAVSTEDYRL
jgi:hypothetical protein